MSLSDIALVTVPQVKAYLKIDAVAALVIEAEYVGMGDGETTVFTLDNAVVEGSLRLYVDGELQMENIDFTLSDTTITFTTAPAPDMPITASYDKVATDGTFESYDNEVFEILIEAATQKAENYTGRAFVQCEITEKHFGDGTTILKLYRQPVVSVSSVTRYHTERVGTGDGETMKFTLDNTPVVDSVKLYVDGVLQVKDTDYTISEATITFVVAPANGAKITANYSTEISDYTEWLNIGRLKREILWAQSYIYEIVYIAGYGVDRVATQALVPQVVNAVLLILAFLWENRVDRVDKDSISGLSSTSYKLPSQAEELLNPYRVGVL